MSYYEMKNRAGVIGRNGLGPMLGKLAAADHGIRIHLMGHSFGARLVAYSLSGLPPPATGAHSPVKTAVPDPGRVLALRVRDPVPDVLVSGPGALSAFIHNVNGPLLATFTAADRAVGWWYPAASMLAHQDAQAADDLTYQWGGMGHDGYQQPHRAGPDPARRAGNGVRLPAWHLLPARLQRRHRRRSVALQRRPQRHPASQVVWPVVDASS